MLTYQWDHHPEPDFDRLLKVLRRDGEPDRVPFFELFSNLEREVLEALGRWEPPEGKDPWDGQLRNHITYQTTLGYDYLNVRPLDFVFPRSELPRAMTTEGERAYYLASSHTIANRAEFEAYPWPDPDKADYSLYERVRPLMPDGAKIITLGPGGVLENVMWLLGYEGLSYLLVDDEPLVRNLFDAVGSRLVKMFDTVAAMEHVGAICLGDDLGHKTQTLVSPEILRVYVFPWHKRIVETAHRHGKPAILHACGNLNEVIGDIIASGWDAKHSFEDGIEPLWSVKRKYGERMAFLGGFDVDRLSRSSPEQVRSHTRFMLEQCAPDGGWALGTGNSVCSYIPVENFLAMVDEGLRSGRY